MKWIKVSEHLPGYVKELYQVSDKYIVRRIDNKSVIKEYFNLYGKEWGLENFEWLDESSPTTTVGSVEEAAKEYAKKECWSCRTGGSSQEPCTCHTLEDAFFAGHAHKGPSLTVDIVEALDKSNPYRLTDGKKSDSWNESVAKLRELIAPQYQEPVERDEFIKKHLAIIRQKTMDAMIELHIVGKRELLKGSLEHFISGGNCNGLFRETILSMLNTAYNWRGTPVASQPPAPTVQGLENTIETINHQDQIIGRLTRQNEFLTNTERKRKEWLSEAKREAGFHDNISFDVVWKAALEAYKSSLKTEGQEEQEQNKN